MKILAIVDVPDGDFCEGCDLWYRAEDKKCYCQLFGMKELEQRFKENMVQGTNIVKCVECKTSMVHEYTQKFCPDCKKYNDCPNSEYREPSGYCDEYEN